MLNFFNDCTCDDPNASSKNRKVVDNVNNNNNNNDNSSINNNITHSVTPLSNRKEQNGIANGNIKCTSGQSYIHGRKRFNRITSKCPEFMQNYCMCLFRRIEPEPDGKIEHQNGTPVIPIIHDSDVYVLFSSLNFKKYPFD